MRDPNRIKPFCDTLAELWESVPDWRFGQLMLNMFSDFEPKTGRDVFYTEDDEMLKYFKDWMASILKQILVDVEQ